MRKRSAIALVLFFTPICAAGCRQILALDDPLRDGGAADASSESDAQSSADTGGIVTPDASMDSGQKTQDADAGPTDSGLIFVPEGGDSGGYCVLGRSNLDMDCKLK